MKKNIFLVLVLVVAAGCASPRAQTLPRKESAAASLKEQLDTVSRKFELAKKENLNLKKQLLLFKRYQDIDTQKFVMAQEVLATELAEEIKNGDVGLQISERGLTISILSERLFVSASDALSDAGKELLDKIQALLEPRFTNNYLLIEGHTDNQSLAVFEWKSDWEFSFARALSVLKYLMQKTGLDPLRLSASGFGQYRPRASNESKEGRRLNRRIEIIVSSQKIKPHPQP